MTEDPIGLLLVLNSLTLDGTDQAEMALALKLTRDLLTVLFQDIKANT